MRNINEILPTISSSEFLKEIDDIVVCKKITYMEAVLLYCEKTGMEIETAASIVKSSIKLKAKIQDDAEQLNFLPKTRKLIYE